MGFTIPAADKSEGDSGIVADLDNLYGAVSQLAAGNVLNAAYAGGADPTGAADSTAAIQAALNTGYALLPPGTYKISAPLSYQPGAILRGPGRGRIDTDTQCTIVAAAAMSAMIAPSQWLDGSGTAVQNEVRMSGFNLDGANLAGHGIVCQNEDSEFDQLAIRQCTGDGIRFDPNNVDGSGPITSGSAVNSRITRCSIQECSRGIAALSGLFTDFFCTDNIIATMSGAAGIYVAHAAGWKITGNHLYGMAQNGIYIAQDHATLVHGNYVETWGASATSATYAAITTATGTTDGSSNGNSGTVIAGNRLTMTAAPGNAASTIVGIRLRCLNSNNSSFAVTGNAINTLTTAWASGFALQWVNAGSAAVLTGTSTGNVVTGAWTSVSSQTPNGGTLTVTAGT